MFRRGLRKALSSNSINSRSLLALAKKIKSNVIFDFRVHYEMRGRFSVLQPYRIIFCDQFIEIVLTKILMFALGTQNRAARFQPSLVLQNPPAEARVPTLLRTHQTQATSGIFQKW